MSKLSIVGILMICAIIAIFWTNRSSRLTGDGKVTTETRTTGSFTKLKVNGIFKTIITQDGGDEWVKVETDENLQKTITIENNGGTLVIGNKDGFNYRNPSKMIVHVNVKTLSSLVNKSVGSLESNGVITADALELKNDAVGKTNLSLHVNKLTAKLSSVGTLYLSGSATEADIDNNSVGKLEAFDLKTDMLTIKNSAVGAVEVSAAKEISIDHNGVGKLEYKGDAMVKALKDNGVGKVSKIN